MASAAPAGKPMSAPAAAAPKADERGEGVGLGGIGTLGHGAGGGGFGDGVGRLGGAHRSAGGVAAPAREFGMFAIQGPSIAAGEWDDNANYHEFQRYLANEERLPLHRVDVTDRRFLVVRDMNGKPVPRCQVTIRDVDQHQTTLTTMASGRAILFPHAEGMTSADLEATTYCPGAIAVHRSFNVTDQDGVVDFRLASAREIPAVRPVDVAFILDTTGSMGEEIDAVRSTIAKVASRLGRENFRVRLALVEYKDRGDVFVTKVHPFSTSTDRFLADISRVTASGGGDLPESVNEGLHVGLTGLEWAQDSVARFAFLIGDAPPHLDYPNDADYAVEMRRAAHQGVQLFTVAASGMDALGQAVFRQVAEYTGGTNLFVLRGGAGPQSTGAGDPKSSCGGTQTNYSSGNLDTLIVSKVTRELHGLDGDPMRIAGLYRDEDAKPCNERVAYND
jgi:hypothetical protein